LVSRILRRSGTRANFASNPALRLLTAAAIKTLFHVPVADSSMPANGTASAETPFAV
jgi:hypothetical protein